MKQNMIRLSVILPMYNVEPYLERCLRSLQEQDISKEEYEIICVNDGSPDNCKQVVLRLQKEYANIVLIDQENQGVSRARNNGIDKARGKYLLFVDPDDYVDQNSFSRILGNADSQNAQVSFLGFSFLEEDGSVRKTIFNSEYSNKVFEGTKAYYISRGDGQMDPDRIWAILFSHDLLNANNLRFKPDIPYLEDGELIVRILFLAERCIFDGHSFYQRTTRLGSATNSNLFYSQRAINGFLRAAINLKNFQIEQKELNKNVDFLNQSVVKFVILCFTSIIGVFGFIKVFKLRKLMRGSGFQTLDLKGCNETYFRLGSFYNISPFILYVYMRISSIVPRFIKLKVNKG